MCLYLGGGGGGQCLEPMYPPTDAARKHKTTLQMVGLAHLMLALTLLLMGGAGFQMFITVMCLFCATLNYNYCCVLIYILYTMIDIFTNINPIGLLLQNSIMGETGVGILTINNLTPEQSTLMIILSVLVVFEIIAIYYAF